VIKIVREFNLINEKGQTFSLMDIENYCLLTEPEGLGCSFYSEYQQVNNSFIKNVQKIEQGQPGGIANFKNYDNYASFVNFIMSAKLLKLQYKIPQKNRTAIYYKDIALKELTKTQKQPNGIISEEIVFDALSIWYEENNFIYNIEEITDELRWDFAWDSVFTDYENRSVLFENNGHVEAPFLLEMAGYILNPTISIFVENEIVNKLSLEVTIEEGEKLIYSTKDNKLQIYKVLSDGTTVNLFDILDLNNINFFKLPIRL